MKKQGVTSKSASRCSSASARAFCSPARQAADKTHYRKWLLVAPAGDFTALVTIQVPEQDKAYPDSAVRAALTTLAVRANVPDAEELSLLPFTVGDLAGFHIDDVLPRPRADAESIRAGRQRSEQGKDQTKDAASSMRVC